MGRDYIMLKGSKAPLDEAAKGRLRRAYVDGLSEEACCKRFRVNRPAFLLIIGDLKRPASEGLKRQTPTGLGRGFL